MTDYLQFAEQQTLNCYDIGWKIFVPKQFVEMLFQNKPWLVGYKKIRAMPFLPSIDCAKFKLKTAFKSGKIIACTGTKRSELCSTSTLKLFKNDAKMPGSASLFHMHALLESDYAILT